MELDLDLDGLQAMAVFAERLNLTQVGQQLGLSQPAVHARLRRLTAAVGRPLYRRHGRRLELTPTGHRVAAFARDVLQRCDALRRDLEGDTRQPIRLWAGEGAYLYLLGPALRRVRKGQGGLALTVADAEATLEAVRSGRADVGVASLDERPRDLRSECIAEVELVVALSEQHRLAGRKRLDLAALADERFIVPPPGRPLRRRLQAEFDAMGRPLDVAVEATGWPLMLELVALGAGVAVVNAFCQRPRRVVFVSLVGLDARSYFALCRRDASGPALDQLWRALTG